MRVKYLPILALITTSFLWSSAFVAIKPMVAVMSPGTLALYRYGLAALIIGLIYLLFCPKTKSATKVKLLAFFCGFIGIGLYNLTLNHAEVTITAATTAFIISGLGPFVSVLISVICLGERPGVRALLGMLCCLLGLFVMTVTHWGYNSLWGIVFAALAATCGGAFNAMQKPLLKTIHPFELMTFAILGGFVSLLPFQWHALVSVPPLSTHMIVMITYLAIFPAIIAYSCWSYGVRNIPVSKAVGAIYLIPVFTAALAWFFNHTMPPLSDWLGGLLTISGAFFINSRRQGVPATKDQTA